MKPSRFFLLLVGAFGALMLSASTCSTPVEVTGCKADRDCNNFERCDIATGFCLCADDQACDATEFCNGEGRCQPKLGCNSNRDCGGPERPSDICDTTTGQCITLDGATLQCVLDSQCPFGSYCDLNSCRPGCRDNGDCGVDVPCINGTCDARPGACNANAYCAYGQICDTAAATCRDHPERATLCAWCDPTDLLDFSCIDDCFIDSSLPADRVCNNDSDCSEWPGAKCDVLRCRDDGDCSGGDVCERIGSLPFGKCSTGTCARNFCGTSGCGDDNPCPLGYECFRSIAVSEDRLCSSDAECPQGSMCSNAGENVNQGYCSCLSDADCGPYECVNPGPGGYCLLGSTCGPASGLLCEDLR